MDIKLQFLERLDHLVNGLSQIVEFLVSARLMTEDEVKALRQKPKSTHALEIQVILQNISNKVHLLDYEWILLPKEVIKLTIITESGAKVISWPV